MDPQNRLCKLVRKVKDYSEFKKEAVWSSSWYLGPYAQTGIAVTNPWLESFYKLHKEKSYENSTRK